MYHGFRFLAGLLLAVVSSACASEAIEVDSILARPAAPAGVVFEIVSGDDAALSWAIPEVQRQADRLRVRFPGLPIAVVTHGREQFALTRENRDRQAILHRAVRQMKNEQDIAVQVCATHAGWRNLQPEDFPDYVGVAASASAALRDYREIGYLRVMVRAP